MTDAEALDVALCWGWIDGIRKSFDEQSFLQRYSPRRPQEHLEPDQPRPRGAADCGRPHDAARPASGRCRQSRWPLGRRLRADPQRRPKRPVPDDLRAAIDANPRARKTFRTLGRQNLFALAFRTNNMKTPAGRARKIAALVAMLARGETIVPERPQARKSGLKGR